MKSTKGTMLAGKIYQELEKPKAAEAVLTDPFISVGIINIDEHIFVWIAGEKTRENFDEFFLHVAVRFEECLADIEPVRPFAAIEPQP